MDINYTPLDVASFQHSQSPRKSFDINAVLISLIIITLLIAIALLYILINKKLNELAYISFFA